MNFFKAQDQARNHTAKLVGLFLLAILSLILLTNLTLFVTLGFMNPEVINTSDLIGQIDWQMFAMVGAAVTVVVMLGTVYKLIQLAGGGHAVAEMMGGKLVSPDSYDHNERKLINVVTEMSIASGTPVPPVYIMEHEQGINAFAAGYTQKDAVVAVTRGTLDMLTRDELQGVIAHEFSHIFNGDMRLNIRLIGILNGILVIGHIGYLMMRASPSSRSSKGNGAMPIVFVGLGLMVIGYAGTFFGNLIKAAVSRQREYLADASAVQFTRNADGISGALKKIGGHAYHARVLNAAAGEISHTFFGEAVPHLMNFMMATHPPLEKRIRVIQPSWDGEFTVPVKIQPDMRESQQQREQWPVIDANSLLTLATMLAIQQGIDSIGQPQQKHLDFARQMMSILPGEILQAAQEPFSARALVYFLLLSHHDETRQQQMQHLLQHADDGVTAVTLRLSSFQQNVGPEYRLSLLNIALSPLQQLTAGQYERFKSNMDALITADDKVELFEWALQKITTHTLDPVFQRRAATRARYKHFDKIEDDCRLLMSVLWYAGNNNDNDIIAFDKVITSLGISSGLLPQQDIKLGHLNRALDRLNLLYPLKKPELLKACASVISLDGEVTPLESELFRAIAEMLDCPMPPIMAA